MPHTLWADNIAFEQERMIWADPAGLTVDEEGLSVIVVN